jgi:HAD superfamily hydrolase (TIGR01549 family)
MKLDASTKTIIWDLDGTLIDSFEIFTEILAEVVVLHSMKMPDRALMVANYHGSLEDTISTVLALSDATILDQVVTDFLHLQQNYYEWPDEHLLEDARSLSKRAKAAGLQQIIVSNRAHEGRGNASPRHIVEHSELADLIDYIVCGDEVEKRKPDAHVLDQVIKDLGFKPEDCLVIGDQFVDAQLAQNIGASAVLVSRGPDEIVHLEKLDKDYKDWLTIVKSLDKITI